MEKNSFFLNLIAAYLFYEARNFIICFQQAIIDPWIHISSWNLEALRLVSRL